MRVSFGKNTQSQAIEITDVNDYYPFGMNHLKSGTAMFGQSSYKNYKYNGKELQETGMYDYGARMYMPDIGRWGVIDEKTEKYRSWSPYNYAINNPVKYIDPDGKDIININGGIKFTGQDAQIAFSAIKSQVNSTGGLGLKGFHFVPESTTPNIYRHTLNAFRGGKPEILHYDPNKERQAERRRENVKILPTKQGFQRDEYPYASTFEGTGANVAYVPSRENSVQGGTLRGVYRNLHEGDAFMVIPVPKDREPEDVKQEALERFPKPVPMVINPPSFERPAVPYKMWPAVMGAAVVAGLIYYSRFMPVIP